MDASGAAGSRFLTSGCRHALPLSDLPCHGGRTPQTSLLGCEPAVKLEGLCTEEGALFPVSVTLHSLLPVAAGLP